MDEWQVGPRISYDRQNFPPNNIIHVLGGAGFLWMGWTGFNGGATFQVGEIASLAIFNTHLCTATSLLVWLTLDMMVYTKSSVIGAVQGMITGLVCITPGAGSILINDDAHSNRSKVSCVISCKNILFNLVFFTYVCEKAWWIHGQQC